MKNVKTELIGGLTTFMAMAYILFVNANILSICGMDKSAVMLATALSSGISTIIMGLWARYPFALAPGMGLNAYFAYSVCVGMNVPWQTVLGAVFLDGLIFLFLSLLPIREQIIKGIPANIKYGISVGIGLFIAFIGLNQAGIVVPSEGTIVKLGDISSPSVLIVIVGLILTSVLLAFRVKGAFLLGIAVLIFIGFFVPAGDGSLTRMPSMLMAIPTSEVI